MTLQRCLSLPSRAEIPEDNAPGCGRECVGMGETTPVRPYSHTQSRSVRAFSIEVGLSRLRSSSRIGKGGADPRPTRLCSPYSVLATPPPPSSAPPRRCQPPRRTSPQSNRRCTAGRLAPRPRSGKDGIRQSPQADAFLRRGPMVIPTGTRVSRMHGFPSIRVGSVVVRSRCPVTP